MLGLCFLAVPTWCPFRALFYLNGHNWLASKLRSANISYELQDNAFATIDDCEKAQQLSDRLMVKQLHTRLDAVVARYLPDLESFGRYHWSILQAEYATDIVFRSAEDLTPLYDHLLRTAIHAGKVDDVATFLCHSPQRIGERESAHARACCFGNSFAVHTRSGCPTSSADRSRPPSGRPPVPILNSVRRCPPYTHPSAHLSARITPVRGFGEWSTKRSAASRNAPGSGVFSVPAAGA